MWGDCGVAGADLGAEFYGSDGVDAAYDYVVVDADVYAFADVVRGGFCLCGYGYDYVGS